MTLIPDRRDRLDKMSTKGLLIERDCLTNIAEVVCAVIDNPDTPADLREKALDANDDLTWWLCFAPGVDEPGRTIRLVPAGIKAGMGFYTQRVEEFLAELHPMLLAEEPARVALARHAAKLADTESYSVDFRTDCLASLDEILTSFRRVADEWAEELEDIETST